MSKKRILSIALIALILAGFFTNPPSEKIRTDVEERVRAILRKELNLKHQDAFELGMQLYGNKLLHELSEQYIVVENYYAFSIIKVRWQSEENTVGIGVFNRTLFSKKIDKKAAEIFHVIKQL